MMNILLISTGTGSNNDGSSYQPSSNKNTNDMSLQSLSLFLLGSSCIMWCSSMVLMHLFSGFPTRALGQRSHGVVGYDAILGCIPNHFKYLMHLSYSMALTGIFLLTLPTSSLIEIQNAIGGGLDVLVLPPIMCYMVFYLSFVVQRSKDVSKPGPPRVQPIKRQPMFSNQTISLSNDTIRKWKCVVAQTSHDVTQNQFSITKTKMTGEPYGRQIWTTTTAPDDDTSNNKDVDEELVLKLAAGGEHKEKYGFNPSNNPNSRDKIFRAQMIRSYLASGKTPPPGSYDTDDTTTTITPLEGAKKGLHFYSMLQTSDGHWAGDYGGPHFLLPGLVVVWYVMGQPTQMINDEQKQGMIHYLKVHQQTDGGWGTHIESPSTMFGSVLCYVALRLLLGNDTIGSPDQDPHLKLGKSFIQQHGGAIMTGSWSKFYLCLLGCMDWKGHNSVPPEMWLLPNWFPFHPSRMWCHARMVYLPMGYLYGTRFVYKQAETDQLILKLRQELYVQPYDTIPWDNTRHDIAPMDNYSPIPWIMKTSQNLLAYYENWNLFDIFRNIVRQRGLQFCLKYMMAEDLQTNYINIGPVNKVLNMLSAYHAAEYKVDDERVQSHMMRIPDYLWVAEDGMKMQGYNGSQCWDTSFAIQAITECHLTDGKFEHVSIKVWDYLERTQILSTSTSQSSPAFIYESPSNRLTSYRHVSQGGWPFSTSAHGWPISDCTGEGLKGVLALNQHCRAVQNGIQDGTLRPISQTRLEDAIEVILTLQNEDGGWATYENNRGFGWYEQLNPSEVFGDIMIDYSYVECSMASMTALSEFNIIYPHNSRHDEIKVSLQKGRSFLKRIQRDDGSWYGSWACCFTYGIWFGIEGLVASGEIPSHSKHIQKACKFLLKHQNNNGGWGEDFTSCYNKSYAPHGMKLFGDEQGSAVVNTSWALLALAAAKCDDVDAIRRGVHYLLKRQLPWGDWPQEGISGVFNRACGITYTSYRNVFPIWALGRCSNVYGNHVLQMEILPKEEDDDEE